MMRFLPFAILLVLSACGMQRAVGVLPNTLDDLGSHAQATRSEALPAR